MSGFITSGINCKDLNTLKTMFLQRYNPWGKTKSEQSQSWNILLFDPNKTDVDEHINLINTLGAMVDQKEEAKMEKFTETMPTMIQTHLIICENWADIKDKAKSLEHIIWKCDPPTPAISLVTMGTTVPGLYSHIAHSGDKEEEYPHHLKRQNQNKSEVEVKQKGNLSITDRTHQKTKRQRKPILMIVLITITTMIITLPQVKIEAADLFNGQSGNQQFRGFTQRSRGQKPQYNQCQFQNYRFQRGTYQHNRNQ